MRFFPASRTITDRVESFSDNREASTRPDVPPPTITYSASNGACNEEDIRCSYDGVSMGYERNKSSELYRTLKCLFERGTDSKCRQEINRDNHSIYTRN